MRRLWRSPQNSGTATGKTFIRDVVKIQRSTSLLDQRSRDRRTEKVQFRTLTPSHFVTDNLFNEREHHILGFANSKSLAPFYAESRARSLSVPSMQQLCCFALQGSKAQNMARRDRRSARPDPLPQPSEAEAEPCRRQCRTPWRKATRRQARRRAQRDAYPQTRGRSTPSRHVAKELVAAIGGYPLVILAHLLLLNEFVNSTPSY